MNIKSEFRSFQRTGVMGHGTKPWVLNAYRVENWCVSLLGVEHTFLFQYMHRCGVVRSCLVQHAVPELCYAGAYRDVLCGDLRFSMS